MHLRATLSRDAGFLDSDLKRTLNVFAFFTVQSNLLVGVTTGLLVQDRRSSGALPSRP